MRFSSKCYEKGGQNIIGGKLQGVFEESNIPMRTSNEYEEEYGLFLYNAT